MLPGFVVDILNIVEVGRDIALQNIPRNQVIRYVTHRTLFKVLLHLLYLVTCRCLQRPESLAVLLNLLQSHLTWDGLDRTRAY